MDKKHDKYDKVARDIDENFISVDAFDCVHVDRESIAAYLRRAFPSDAESGEDAPTQRHGLIFVDATPDAGYPVRILSAYLDDSYYSDNTAGLPPENPLIVKMNEWRVQRNALLRAALDKLAANEPAPSSPQKGETE